MTTAAQTKQPAPPPRVPRLTLASVVRGKLQQPPRIFVYGVEGIGKSTLGAGAPKPIILGVEDGTGRIDVPRFPTPRDLVDVLDAISELTTGAHDYQTLVVDTVDWLEPLIWEFICKRDDQVNIEGYGYGKGYQVALDEWRKLLGAFEKLRSTKKMGVVLLGHSFIKPFKNPEGEDFDRYELKVHSKAGGLLKEWCDAVLFANYETFAKKSEKDAKSKFAKAKGVSTGARLLFTERTAAYDGKNRYGLPSQIPLSWADLEAAMVAGQPVDTETLISEVKRKAAELVPAELEKVTAALARAGVDNLKLTQLNNYVNARLAEATAQQAPEAAKEG